MHDRRIQIMALYLYQSISHCSQLLGITYYAAANLNNGKSVWLIGAKLIDVIAGFRNALGRRRRVMRSDEEGVRVSGGYAPRNER